MSLFQRNPFIYRSSNLCQSYRLAGLDAIDRLRELGSVSFLENLFSKQTEIINMKLFDSEEDDFRIVGSVPRTGLFLIGKIELKQMENVHGRGAEYRDTEIVINAKRKTFYNRCDESSGEVNRDGKAYIMEE